MRHSFGLSSTQPDGAGPLCCRLLYGVQHQTNRQVAQAIVDYRQAETARLAKAMPHKTLTVTQDETFIGGLCLVAIEPVSNFVILEQLAQTRDQGVWNALMAPALQQLNCEVMQSTSAEAPGLLAYVEHHLGAHPGARLVPCSA